MSAARAKTPRLTVLTPTFNRASTLPRLFESLLAQTWTDFEWLVIDDGSTDGTAALIEQMRAEAPFEIHYSWQENGGKHIALNRGLEQVRTELCAVMDSDDWYIADGLERLIRRWDELPSGGDREFADVEGRCRLPDGSQIGSVLETEILDSDTYEAVIQHGMKGDTCGVWRTDVLRAYPFPEDLGPFVSEILVFNRIAVRYRTRYCSDVVAIREYRSGGLSDRLSDTQRLVESAPARLVHDRELLGFGRPMPFGVRVRTHANETRNAMHLGQGARTQWRETPRRLGWLCTLPLGIALYLRDRIRLKRGANG